MKRILLFCCSVLAATWSISQNPVISVNPTSLQEALYTGDSSVQQITISNQGTADLACAIFVEPTSPTGVVNNAANFDGDNDYAKVYNNPVLQLTDSLTIEAWINFEEGGHGDPVIVVKGIDNPSYKVFLDTALQSTTIGMMLNPIDTIMSQTALNAGTWYHFAFTYDGSVMKVYINGVLDNTQTASGILNTANYYLYMAKQGNTGENHYKGAIDELRIWNIARSQDEIIQDLNIELSGMETGLVGYWKFNEEDGNTAYDATIYSNTATLMLGADFDTSGSKIINWLDITPATIDVLPGNSADLDVDFVAHVLDGDTYEGQFVINSNDPITPHLIVPVQLQVTPVAKISLSVSLLDFGNVYTGQSKSMEFAVSNLGNDTLDVSSMTCPNADYTIIPPTLFIAPEDTDTVNVIYSPVDPEIDNTILTIVSNDLNTPTVNINLKGTGVSPPVIELTPQSLDTSLYSGNHAYQTLTVFNNGMSELDFEVGNLALELAQGYVQVENPSLYMLDQFTLETWVYIDYYWQLGGLISLGNADSERFSMHYDHGNIIYSQDWPDQGYYYNLPAPPTDEWHHLALTHDGSTIRYYIDGMLTTTLNTPGPENYSENYALYIGNQIGDYPEILDGTIDDVRIWNVVRTGEEILDNMMFDLSGSEAGLAGNWKMDVVLEDLVLDASDNENHGTLYGEAHYIYFDMMPSWLSLSSSTGLCPADSSLDVEVHYDASLMTGREYSYALKFLSNDPISPAVSIPVTLNVTDAPSINANQDTLDFGILYLGFDDSDTLQVEISNNGSLDLLITQVSVNPGEFDVYPTFASIDPGDIDIFNVVFTPDDIGEYISVLTLTNNDPLYESLEIVLTGKYLVPPLISVTPESLDAVLFSGKTTTRYFTISNTGGSDLMWEISLENVGLPTTTFTKEDWANWTDPANQDCITENVCITRANQQGIFNAKTEDSYSSYRSPEDTEWAYGYTQDLDPEDYQVWVNAINGNPPGMINNPLSLHLISDDIYLDVIFHSWTSGGNGGGFSYTRSSVLPPWIQVSQESGILTPGSTTEIEVIFDASFMEGGLYEGTIVINNNDPLHPAESVHGLLEVIDAPSFYTEQDTLDFGIVFPGYEKDLELLVTNNGSEDLLITEVTAEPAQYSVFPPYAGIDPCETEIFVASFAPQDIGDYDGTLMFANNDPLSNPFVITLMGQCLDPPIISVLPDSIYVEVMPGYTASESFMLNNIGSSDLVWEISIENGGLPTVTFTKEDYADWTDPANQDCITLNVCITRANQQGIFNAKTEDSYSSYRSPEDTEWAYGYTQDLDPEDYQVWRDAINGNPPGMINNPLSLHLISDDIYLDVIFHSWTSGGNGGGFSYTRTGLIPVWIQVSQESGILPSDSTKEFEVIFDASELEDGHYYAMIVISSNDPTSSLTGIPVHMMVGNPVGTISHSDVNDLQLRCYPNPFTGMTAVSYTIKEAAHVNLLVYNSFGKMVAELHDGAQIAGTHNLYWNAEHLSAGMYYCRLTTGNKVAVIKMLVMQ